MKTTAFFFFKIDTLRLFTKYRLTQALIMACYEIIRSHKYYEGGYTHISLHVYPSKTSPEQLQHYNGESLNLSLYFEDVSPNLTS